MKKFVIILVGSINLIYSIFKLISEATRDEWGIYYNKDYVVWIISSLLVLSIGLLTKNNE